jgi:pimeloyl-ACP methyl ester carboxylesterase
MNPLHTLDPNPSGEKTVLFLHGLGANGASWQLQFAPLIKKGFRPIAPDAPGFGESPYDGKGWTIKRVASQMIDLLDGLTINRAHIVGLSLGGVIASQIAIDFPQRVDKLVLASTFARLRPKSLSESIYFLRRAVVAFTVSVPAQARLVAQRVFPRPDQEPLREMLVAEISRADPRAYRGAMRSLGLFNVSRRLREIKIPTLIISGANDSTVTPSAQKALADGIPGARQVIVVDAGHAVNVDQYEIFNRILLEFLG